MEWTWISPFLTGSFGSNILIAAIVACVGGVLLIVALIVSVVVICAKARTKRGK